MSEFELLDVRPVTDAEQARSKWFDEQRLTSVDTLDNAARLIIGLVSGILTILFGILALSGEPGKLPIYANIPMVRWLAALGVLLQFASLAAGLAVVMPGRWVSNPNRPGSEASAFEGILRTKSRWLTASIWCFGAGIAAIGAVLLLAILTVSPAANPLPAP